MPNLWLSFFHPISASFRRRRFAQILRQEPELLTKRILDLGGSVSFWQKAGVDLGSHDITILNIAADAQSSDMSGKVIASSIVLYDGSTIPWADGHFDWVISNSVIEHVPPEQRPRFSSEIRRVGLNYLVQTPAFAFPIEPHFVMPFLHWLPRSMGRLVAGFGLWGLLRRRRRADICRYFDEVNLLTLKEFRSLFPEGELSVERFAGVPKSYSLLLHRDRIAGTTQDNPSSLRVETLSSRAIM
jgi:Methyltransferase domain